VREDIDAAQKRWDDKDLELSGLLVDAIDFGGYYAAYLGTDPETTWAQQFSGECKTSAAEFEGVQNGSYIVVNGTVSSVMADGIYLESCRLISFTPPEGPVEGAIPGDEIDPKAGPVFLTRDGDKGYVTQIDPDTGESVTIWESIPLSGYEYTVQWSTTNLSGRVTEQLFDPELERLAVNWSESSDRSKHVGWLDRNGEVTDVTAALAGDSSGFSAKAPQHTNALFDADGLFFFENRGDDGKTTYSLLDPNDMSLVADQEEFDPPGCAFSYATDPINGSAVFDLDGRLTRNETSTGSGTYTCWVLPNGDRVASIQRRALADLIDDGVGLYVDRAGLIAYTPSDDQPDDRGLYFPGENGEAGVKRLTPETDYQIVNAAASGDKIAFTAQRGQETALFVTSTNGGEPTKVADLSAGSGKSTPQLLFWK
jgi:hypothetical protein